MFSSELQIPLLDRTEPRAGPKAVCWCVSSLRYNHFQTYLRALVAAYISPSPSQGTTHNPASNEVMVGMAGQGSNLWSESVLVQPRVCQWLNSSVSFLRPRTHYQDEIDVSSLPYLSQISFFF